MKNTKKILSLILAVLMLVAVVPMGVSAVNGVQGKIDEILNVFPAGGYFTVNSKSCAHSSGSTCSNCQLSEILKSRGIKHDGKISPDGWTCYAFASYCFGYIFGHSFMSAIGIASSGRVSDNQGLYNVFKLAKKGDFVYCWKPKNETPAHYAIFISCDSNGVTLLHNNIGGGTTSVGKIAYGYITYENLRVGGYGYDRVDIYRASNYDEINATDNTTETGNRVEFNGHYYQVFDESSDWFQAKKKCEDLGGHLVTITSNEEQTFIESILTKKNKRNYWAGATDSEAEGEWKWITGEEFKYTNWNVNEPNNTEYFQGEFENYLQISTSANNMWNDSYFDGGERVYGGVGVDYYGFICEWDSPTESTPCKHTNSVNKPQLDPNCIDIGFTAGVYCNDCETWLSGHEVIAASDHKDANKDGKCDTCMKQLSKPSEPEQPKKNIIQIVVDAVKNVVNNIVNFFKKLFRI